MGKQVVFDVRESAERLGKDLENLAPAMESALSEAIRGVAESAYATIMSRAQSELNGTRQDYIKSLNFNDLGDGSYLISLDGEWANALESGQASYDMREKLLKSNKIVEVGSRAGQPWVQHSKPGKDGKTHKYAHVPFEKQPFANAGAAGNMADAIQALKGVNAKGNLQKLTKVFKGLDGKALEGRVATAHPGSVSDSRLQDLVKYQSLSINSKGKETVRSTYISFRTISEIGKPWIQPARTGLGLFDDAEREVQAQIDKILNVLL